MYSALEPRKSKLSSAGFDSEELSDNRLASEVPRYQNVVGQNRTMSTKLLLGCSLLVLVGCASGALGPLVLDGPELHASLVTRKLEDAATLQLAGVLRANPSLSSDAEFVDLLARIASQDRLGGGEGIRAALYALYLGEREVGLYGLEAASPADADRIEGVLRRVWSHNEGLGLARVHREGKVLVVVWSNGVSPANWEAVNAEVVERLTDH